MLIRGPFRQEHQTQLIGRLVLEQEPLAIVRADVGTEPDLNIIVPEFGQRMLSYDDCTHHADAMADELGPVEVPARNMNAVSISVFLDHPFVFITRHGNNAILVLVDDSVSFAGLKKFTENEIYHRWGDRVFSAIRKGIAMDVIFERPLERISVSKVM